MKGDNQHLAIKAEGGSYAFLKVPADGRETAFR